MKMNTALAHTKTEREPALDILRDLSNDLILSEIACINSKEKLHRGIRSVYKLGIDIDSVCEACGIRSEVVKKILISPERGDDLDLLAGLEM